MPRVACVQTDVVFGDVAVNVSRAVDLMPEADLVVFPECFLTGYCFDSPSDAKTFALPTETHLCGDLTPPSMLAPLVLACHEKGAHVVIGFAGSSGVHLYNGAFLIEPNGQVRQYVKTHLPELGLDRFVTPGDDLPVFETSIGRIGILICFDLRPPEPSRVMALKGADVICLPTNWPLGATGYLSLGVRTTENRVFFAACNRVGTERGFGFQGRSSIVDPAGRVLASAEDGEAVLVADCDFALARQKRVHVEPSNYDFTIFESRRPELYGVLGDSI
jgi:predicted amidohydrolase